MHNAWQEPTPDALAAVPAVVGVYEIADADGRLLYIGQAGGREPFGLRSRIRSHFEPGEANHVLREQGARFRWQSNQQYTTARLERLMFYARDHDGALPPAHAAGDWRDRPTLGRLGPRPAART